MSTLNYQYMKLQSSKKLTLPSNSQNVMQVTEVLDSSRFTLKNIYQNITKHPKLNNILRNKYSQTSCIKVELDHFLGSTRSCQFRLLIWTSVYNHHLPASKHGYSYVYLQIRKRGMSEFIPLKFPSYSKQTWFSNMNSMKR